MLARQGCRPARLWRCVRREASSSSGWGLSASRRTDRYKGVVGKTGTLLSRRGLSRLHSAEANTDADGTIKIGFQAVCYISQRQRMYIGWQSR